MICLDMKTVSPFSRFQSVDREGKRMFQRSVAFETFCLQRQVDYQSVSFVAEFMWLWLDIARS